MGLRSLLPAAASLVFAHAIAHEGAHGASHDAGVASTPAVQASVSPREQAARIFFGDRRLVTQDGNEVAFWTDMLKDHVVLLNFIFTHCTDACPTQSARVEVVQALLRAAPAARVRLISISVDPDRDSPAVLAAYAATFHAGRDWTFLTGSKANVDDVLRRLGQLTAEPRAHTSLYIVGNAATGHWMKLHPDSPPAAIAAELRSLAAE